jgi:putative tryptophan/tyrosine transport system substrate-binding protein
MVLRGTSPADIPIEEASRFEISVNLKTARLIGVTVPQVFLLKTNVIVPAE